MADDCFSLKGTYHLEPGVVEVPSVDGQVVEVHPRVALVVATLDLAAFALQTETGLKRNSPFVH